MPGIVKTVAASLNMRANISLSMPTRQAPRKHDFLSLFSRYNITTFCAPPTAYRVFVKRDLSKYGIMDLQYATTAGEALNPEVWQQFYDKTGLKLMEGFGQTETTLSLGNFVGTEPKPGSMRALKRRSGSSKK